MKFKQRIKVGRFYIGRAAGDHTWAYGIWVRRKDKPRQYLKLFMIERPYEN